MLIITGLLPSSSKKRNFRYEGNVLKVMLLSFWLCTFLVMSNVMCSWISSTYKRDSFELCLLFSCFYFFLIESVIGSTFETNDEQSHAKFVIHNCLYHQ